METQQLSFLPLHWFRASPHSHSIFAHTVFSTSFIYADTVLSRHTLATRSKLLANVWNWRFIQRELQGNIWSGSSSVEFSKVHCAAKREHQYLQQYLFLHHEDNVPWQPQREGARAKSWMQVSENSRQTPTRERNLCRKWSEHSM